MSIVFLLAFRYLRDNAMIPEINKNKIIGYSQYFGYPLYLDTIIFFVFILYPVIFFLIADHFRNDKVDKK